MSPVIELRELENRVRALQALARSLEERLEILAAQVQVLSRKCGLASLQLDQD